MVIQFIIIFFQLFLTVDFNQKVKRTLTPLSETEIVHALNDGHIAEFGYEPKHHRLEVATAQIFLENGRGKLIYCNNFGMIGAGPHEKYFKISGHKMRAAISPVDGAKAYWHAMRVGHSGSLRWFDAGDPKNAAYQLARSGYHRTDKDAYAKILSELYTAGVRAVKNAK